MELDSRNLRDLLAKCLFGGNWEKYIEFVIPRRGNFINPQCLTDTDTYAIYYIDKKERRIANFETERFGEDAATVSRYSTIKMTICVQFIGKNAEKWADSLLFWDDRKDVQEVFMQYQSQLLLGDRLIDTVPFQQEGFNGEMSYLASFETISNVSHGEKVEYWTAPVWFKGNLIVEK